MEPTKLTEPTFSHRSLPDGIPAGKINLFQSVLKQSVPASELLEFKNVTAMGSGWLFQGAKLIDESFAPNRIPSKIRSLKAIPRMFGARISAPTIETGVWISDDFSRNYYHWLTDTIPRLYVFHKQGLDTPVVLPERLKKFNYILETLKLFQKTPPIFIPYKKALNIETLFLPTYVGETYNTNEKVLRSLRKMFQKQYSTKTKMGQRIYISRAIAKTRRIANEKALIPVLEKYGFQVVQFEKLSFRDQVELAASSSIIVGAHGAGLANIFFMPEGGTLIEISQTDDPRFLPCFFTLASALNLNYFIALGTKVEKKASSQIDNIYINPATLEQNIIKALNHL